MASIHNSQRSDIEVLPDVLTAGLDIVFCGTAPGMQSARRKAYYAGPGNAFWSTLHEVGLTPRRFAPEEYAQVTGHGIGLTDLAKYTSGSDSVLSAADFAPRDLRKKLLKYRPKILAFTSKRAAQEFMGHPLDYGLVPVLSEGARLFVLTSPSGLARSYWQDGRYWRELADLRRRLFERPASAVNRWV